MKEELVQCCKLEFWTFAFTCFSLVLFAGVTSGLALGLLSFTPVDLEVLLKAGKPLDRLNAAKILPLLKNEHLLLCTLLIAKSVAMEALPIFLDSIFPTWGAIIISVILVVGFVEIIPQAVCSKHGLSIGARSTFLVQFLILVFFPFSYPISKMLDWLLGKGHSVLLRRAELKTLVNFHANEAGKGGDLSHHETSIIAGALDLTQKTAKEAMTPISQTFSLGINCKLDMHTMRLVMNKGHSRIPIHSGNPNNVIGLILAKNLIFCRPEDETPIKYLTIRKIPRVQEDWPLYDILNQFQKGHSHMAVVVKYKQTINNPGSTNAASKPPLDKRFMTQRDSLNISVNSSPLYSTDTDQFQSCTLTLQNLMEQDTSPEQEYGNMSYDEIESFGRNLDEEAVGIITMEDVLEELLQKDIFDETDQYVDLHNKIRINFSPSRSSRRASNLQVHRRSTPEPPIVRQNLSASSEKFMQDHAGKAYTRRQPNLMKLLSDKKAPSSSAVTEYKPKIQCHVAAEYKLRF
ncbi:hypothetical protein ACFE04_010554 [Oxalis oulophora]